MAEMIQKSIPVISMTQVSELTNGKLRFNNETNSIEILDDSIDHPVEFALQICKMMVAINSKYIVPSAIANKEKQKDIALFFKGTPFVDKEENLYVEHMYQLTFPNKQHEVLDIEEVTSSVEI